MKMCAEQRRVPPGPRPADAAAPPPPGETGRELSGAESLAALSDAVLDITGQPRVRFSNVKDIEVKRVGRWIVITVKHQGKDTNTLTFRIGSAWAKALSNRLQSVLP